MATAREKKVQSIYTKIVEAASGPGTRENKLINAINELKDKEELLRLFTIVREKHEWVSFTGYLTGELGRFGGEDDINTIKNIQEKFAKLGVTLNYKVARNQYNAPTNLVEYDDGNIANFPNGEDLKPDVGPLPDLVDTTPSTTPENELVDTTQTTSSATTEPVVEETPREITPPPGFSPTLINNMIRDLISYYESSFGEETSFSGIIPVVINLELKGIAGIKIGNIFNIKGGNDVYKNILPEAYRNKKLNFLVKTLGHSVQNNYWTTKIEGYPFIANFKNNTKLNKSKFAVSAANNKKPWSLLLNSAGTIFIDTQKFANTQTADDVFYKQVIEGIGAQWNNKTKLIMYAWRQAEGGKATNNPFNTTLNAGADNEGCYYNCLKDGKGAEPSSCRTCPTGYNPGVRNYKTPAVGVRATISTLKESRYTDIVNAIKNNDIDGFILALSKSQWGTVSSLVSKIIKGYADGATPKPPPIYSYKA